MDINHFFEAADNPKLEGFSFGIVTNAKVGKDTKGVRVGTVELRRDFDEDIVFDYEEGADLVEFINGNGYPYFEPAPLSWSRLRDSGIPIGLVIFDSESEQGKEVKEVVIGVAKAFLGKIGFASIGAEYLEKSKELGTSGSKLPTVVVINPIGLNYPYPDTSELTGPSLTEWLQAILSGDVKAHFKSQPVPEENDGPVTVIVGYNFAEIVLDPTKDVLVEFYAPWCGHCKQLEPVYEELGEHFEGDDSIVIGKMDATANDNNVVRLEGFPTIFLFKKNQKDKPVEFTGPRTLENLIAFVKSGNEVHIQNEHDEHDHEHDEL